MNYFPLKHPDETFPIEVDFSRFTDALTSAVVSLTVFRGTDAAPEAVLLGAPVVSGGKVTQRVTAGLPDVHYVYKIKAYDGTNWWVDERILPVGEIHHG